jgi:hypothetical protein
LTRLVAIAVGVAVGVACCVAVAHAQSPDPTVVVAPAAPAPSFTTTGADFTWPTLVGYGITRFLTVLERMVTDTRGWLDRWLDKTNGKIRVDYRKTVVSTWAEEDPDRTGPIRMNRRRDDPGRNGTHGSDQ